MIWGIFTPEQFDIFILTLDIEINILIAVLISHKLTTLLEDLLCPFSK